MWEGTHGGRRVCIKVLRVSLNDDESLTKVCVRHWHIISLLIKSHPVGAVVILQRGCRVEAFKTSKCRSLPWRYKQTIAICVGVDAERNLNALYQGGSGRRSDRTRESSLRNQI